MIIRPKRKGKKKVHSKNYRNLQVNSIESFLEPPKKSSIKYKAVPDVIRDSFGEALVSDWLRKHAIKFIREKTFRDLVNPATSQNLRMDFFLPGKKICIEFDGKQHFQVVKKFDGKDKTELIKRQFRDSVKDRFCIHRGFKMIRISYKDMKNISKILALSVL